MRNDLPEADWKYMRGVKSGLLNQLYERINQQTSSLLSDETRNAHDKYLAVYRHIDEADDIVAECFNDWRRSTLVMKLLSLRKHNLLTDEHLQHLSARTAGSIRLLMGE